MIIDCLLKHQLHILLSFFVALFVMTMLENTQSKFPLEVVRWLKACHDLLKSCWVELSEHIFSGVLLLRTFDFTAVELGYSRLLVGE